MRCQISNFITLRPAARSVLVALVLGLGHGLTQESAPIAPPVKPAPSAEKPPGESQKEIEAAELQLATKRAVEKLRDVEAELAAMKAKFEQIAQSLAAANEDAGKLKEEYGRLKLQTEAVGLDALGGNERTLQLRLLHALNDFRVAEKEKQQLSEQLVRVCEASLAFMKSGDKESRLRLETSLQEANALLHKTTDDSAPKATPIEQARVVSFKKELGLAVINAGKESSLRMGMPISFIRHDQEIGKGVIVDCREQICGILITEMADEKDSVTIGDHIQIQPTQKDAKE